MRTITIMGDDAGQRIDRFVRKLLPRASLGLVYSLIRKRRILLNDTKSEIHAILADGDTISFSLPDDDFRELSRSVSAAPERTLSGARLDPSTILFEDNSLLIVNKDAGMNVHP